MIEPTESESEQAYLDTLCALGLVVDDRGIIRRSIWSLGCDDNDAGALLGSEPDDGPMSSTPSV